MIGCRVIRSAIRSVVLAWLVLVPQRAAAHDRTTSYSAWQIDGARARVVVRLSALDVSRFPWAATGERHAAEHRLADYLTSHLQLLSGDTPCAVREGPRPLNATPGRLAYEWSVDCQQTGRLEIRSTLFVEVASAHLHFARVARKGLPVERVLSAREPVWPLEDASASPGVGTAGTSLPGYVLIGIEHILSGYDHLTFLLALLLIGGSLGEVAKVVTGFTVAHSITLGLAVLGYVRPEQASVEALIGLSIALVAAENVWVLGPCSRAVPRLIAATLAVLALVAATGHGRVPALTLAGLALFSLCYFDLLGRVARAGSLRWAIAFIFGLVHGFGFASVLVEAGLPTERLVQALCGFNIGVELGQLMVVAFIWPLLRFALRRGEGWRLAILNYGSAATLAVGVFWFVSRAFG